MAEPKQTFGDKMSGTKKFILSCLSIVCSSGLAWLIYEPNAELQTPENLSLVKDIILTGYGVGGGGLVLQMLHDYLKGKK